MADNAAQLVALQTTGVLYYPYVEPTPDADKGLLMALAQRACVVVTDDFPSHFLPRMVAAVAERLPVRLEKVDSNGLLPLRASDRVFTTAYSFRAFLQKELPEHLAEFPVSNPLLGVKLPPIVSLPPEVAQRWPAASGRLLGGDHRELARLAIDHRVSALSERGGPVEAQKRLTSFLSLRLPSYAENGNQPDDNLRSELSPYLHFGHISPHQLFDALVAHEGWTPAKLGKSGRGKRAGWWGMGPSAEAWLDQFITWRELGYNMSSHRPDYDRYESLPVWAQATLAKHADDPRPMVYSLDEFAEARTHDGLWNASQRQLLREGRIHNYLRMLWGKKILEWTRSPQEALDIMIELNNRYAIDGRNPNSYSGIFWVLGRYDRPWGPQRPIFGTVRYMSSENARRKLRVENYLQQYGNCNG
jgi:deoxyribodipyrimidine photo-lyase